jgi:hypothetical protein
MKMKYIASNIQKLKKIHYQEICTIRNVKERRSFRQKEIDTRRKSKSHKGMKSTGIGKSWINIKYIFFFLSFGSAGGLNSGNLLCKCSTT